MDDALSPPKSFNVPYPNGERSFGKIWTVKTDLLKTKQNETMSIESLCCIILVHCSRSPFLLWSISLRRAKGGFFSVSFGVVGVVGGSTGCEASDGVCICLSAGFLVFSIGMGRLVLGFGSGGLCVEVTGNGLGGWGSGDLRNRGKVVASHRSSLIMWQGGCWDTGMYFLKYFRLRIVTLPDPSTLTTYWSHWRTSIMMPALSHFVRCGPVEAPVWIGVVSDKPFNSFNSNFCSAVWVWECYWGKSMMYTPFLKELLCGCCGELWSAICCAFIRDAKCHKCAS